jgi:hypothetical protein
MVSNLDFNAEYHQGWVAADDIEKRHLLDQMDCGNGLSCHKKFLQPLYSLCEWSQKYLKIIQLRIMQQVLCDDMNLFGYKGGTWTTYKSSYGHTTEIQLQSKGSQMYIWKI